MWWSIVICDYQEIIQRFQGCTKHAGMGGERGSLPVKCWHFKIMPKGLNNTWLPANVPSAATHYPVQLTATEKSWRQFIKNALELFMSTNARCAKISANIDTFPMTRVICWWQFLRCNAHLIPLSVLATMMLSIIMSAFCFPILLWMRRGNYHTLYSLEKCQKVERPQRA